MPAGKMMLGMARTVAGGKTAAFEQMRIEEVDGRLIFTAVPSGQGEASFTAIELTDSKVTFENLKHDFPNRVIYRKQPDGSVIARIEGNQEDKVKGVDFPLKRTACPGGDTKPR